MPQDRSNSGERPPEIPVPITRNPAADKRGEHRIAIQTRVTLEFLSNTDTWRPSVQIGRSIDVSMRGTKVLLGELPTEIYNRLLHDFRRVLVTFTSPEDGTTIQLRGQIIWIDYHKDKAGEESGPCYLGVFFDDSNEASTARYDKLINVLRGE